MLKSTPKLDAATGEIGRILTALRAGIDPCKLAREFAVHHPENPAVARRLVDLSLACLWLVENAPAGDVLTMLETRHRFELSSAASRSYAIEILRAAEHELQALRDQPKSAPKEHEYAAA